MRLRLSRALRSARLCALLPLSVVACLGFTTLTGCGGGSSTTLQRGPTVSAPVAPLSTISEANATLPFSGKDVTVRVEINSTTALDTTANPPKINILGPGNTTVIGGQQPLTAVADDASGWTYVYNIPTGTPTQQYTFLIYAQDSFGNKGDTPFNLGTVSLP
jgi:hypothetical protein